MNQRETDLGEGRKERDGKRPMRVCERKTEREREREEGRERGREGETESETERRIEEEEQTERGGGCQLSLLPVSISHGRAAQKPR